MGFLLEALFHSNKKLKTIYFGGYKVIKKKIKVTSKFVKVMACFTLISSVAFPYFLINKKVEAQVSVQNNTPVSQLVEKEKTISNAKPILTMETPKKIEIAQGDTLSIKGSVSDPDSISDTDIHMLFSLDNSNELELAEVKSSVNGSTFEEFIPGLDKGKHIIKLWGVDSENGKSKKKKIIINVVDKTAPEIAVLNLRDGDIVKDEVIPILDIKDDTGPITTKMELDGNKYIVNTPITTVGVHRLKITSIDGVGNARIKSINFTIIKY